MSYDPRQFDTYCFPASFTAPSALSNAKSALPTSR